MAPESSEGPENGQKNGQMNGQSNGGAAQRSRKKRGLSKAAKAAMAVTIIAAVLIVGLWGMWGGEGNYLGVSDITSNQSKYLNKYIEVRGTVKPGSHDPVNKTFVLQQDSSELIVNYTGAPPSNFEEGKDVVVKGTLRSEGTPVLLAKEIVVGCASKY
jgi:cytochrome c-type biogenesis protein CcmE